MNLFTWALSVPDGDDETVAFRRLDRADRNVREKSNLPTGIVVCVLKTYVGNLQKKTSSFFTAVYKRSYYFV